MSNFISQQISDSARDFYNIVWPNISQIAFVGGGQLRLVEAVADKDFKDELDLLAGIDAWQVQYAPSAIRGIASRVQWGEARRTFTIRTRSVGGGETEFEKRIRAIENVDNGHLFPHLTIQAYLDNKGGNFICAAAIRTIDLMSCAAFLKTHMKYNSKLYGYQQNQDGSEFMYIAWDYLSHKKVEFAIV